MASRIGTLLPPEWLKAWVNCLAWAYPAFWTANSLLNGVPAVLQVCFRGHYFGWVNVSEWGVRAVSFPGGVAGPIMERRTASILGEMLSPIALMAGVLLLLYWLRWKRHLLGGVFAAMLGEAGGTLHIFNMRMPGWAGVLRISGLILFFAALCLGLIWILQAWQARAYGERLLNLVAGFIFVPGGLWAVIDWQSHTDVRYLSLASFLALAGVNLAAALIAALVPRQACAGRRVGLRAGVIGAVLSIAIFGMTQYVATARRAVRAESWSRLLAPFPANSQAASYQKIFFQKGVSFAAEGPGGYRSEAAVKMLGQLPRFGVNAVALIPYGFERRGSTDIAIGGSMETDEGLEGLARVAHALGMKVMLKPGMWTDGGGFAGDLDFPDSAARARWFASYQRLVEHYAALATRMHADVFCIGGEFVKLSRYDADWRRLIQRARELYPGPIVYAANFGQEFETLTFWDALDYIGLQEYYPLPDDLTTTEIVAKVEAVEKKYRKPVIFTEAGFPSAAGANRKPWDDSGGNVSLDLQTPCYDAIFRAFYGQPWFEGVYWWKVGTNPGGGPEDTSHTPWGKPAMRVIARYYLAPSR